MSNTLLKLYLTEKDFGCKKNDKDKVGIAGATNEVATQKLVTDPPPEGKEHRTPEMYYKSVLKGARTIAGECSKDVIFE